MHPQKWAARGGAVFASAMLLLLATQVAAPGQVGRLVRNAIGFKMTFSASDYAELKTYKTSNTVLGLIDDDVTVVADHLRGGMFRWDDDDLSARLTTNSVTVSTGEINASTDVIAHALHRYNDGDPVVVSGSTDLAAGTVYFIHHINFNSYTYHPTRADAVANTSKIDLLADGDGHITKRLADYYSCNNVIPTGLAVDGSAGAWVRMDLAHGVSSLNCGAKGDVADNNGGGGTDDSVAYYAALDYLIAAGGGDLDVPLAPAGLGYSVYLDLTTRVQHGLPNTRWHGHGYIKEYGSASRLFGQPGKPAVIDINILTKTADDSAYDNATDGQFNSGLNLEGVTLRSAGSGGASVCSGSTSTNDYVLRLVRSSGEIESSRLEGGLVSGLYNFYGQYTKLWGGFAVACSTGGGNAIAVHFVTGTEATSSNEVVIRDGDINSSDRLLVFEGGLNTRISNIKFQQQFNASLAAVMLKPGLSASNLEAMWFVGNYFESNEGPVDLQVAGGAQSLTVNIMSNSFGDATDTWSMHITSAQANIIGNQLRNASPTFISDGGVDGAFIKYSGNTKQIGTKSFTGAGSCLIEESPGFMETTAAIVEYSPGCNITMSVGVPGFNAGNGTTGDVIIDSSNMLESNLAGIFAIKHAYGVQPFKKDGMGSIDFTGSLIGGEISIACGKVGDGGAAAAGRYGFVADNGGITAAELIWSTNDSWADMPAPAVSSGTLTIGVPSGGVNGNCTGFVEYSGTQ